MATIKQNHSTPFTLTGTGATQVVLTQASSTTLTFYITDISASSDMSTSVCLVKSGNNLLWQNIVGNTTAYTSNFVQPIVCPIGTTLTVMVNGAAACYANIGGFIVNNS